LPPSPLGEGGRGEEVDIHITGNVEFRNILMYIFTGYVRYLIISFRKTIFYYF